MNEYKDAAMPKGAMDLSVNDVLHRVASHDFMDEIEVSNKYLDYAVALDDAGRDCIAKKFAEMAYEEYTHAHVQRDILFEQGCQIPSETTVAFEQLKHRIHTLFRK